MTDRVRPAAAVGTFYPGVRAHLVEVVDLLLQGAEPWGGARPRGLVVPHAGYVYSGPVAASAYVAVRPWADEIVRVVVVGPAHFVPLVGSVVSSAPAWRTPLGDVPIDEDLRDAATGAGCTVDEEAHDREHAVEVQLPFLQRLVEDRLRFLPVAVGETKAGQVARILEALDPLTDLFVVSTDLSHYEDIETARTLDRRTADAVLARDAEALGRWDACGVFALRGALAFARATSRQMQLLDLRTSGDTAGGPERVVGYGAFVLV
jgi:MEMO1 family protein